MNMTVKSIQLFVTLFIILASAALIVMMIIIVLNIAGRVFLGTPILGAIELSGLTGVVLVAVAVGIAERDRRNIFVDLVTSRFSPRFRAIVDSITLLISLVALAILFLATFNYSLKALTSGERTDVLEVGTAPFKFFWAFGILILCVYVIQHMIGAFRKGLKK
jgi:TRAP-type C4-dicarboxylate transport system permease small subunit